MSVEFKGPYFLKPDTLKGKENSPNEVHLVFECSTFIRLYLVYLQLYLDPAE